MVDSAQKSLEQIRKKYLSSKKRKAQTDNLEADSIPKEPKLKKSEIVVENEKKELDDDEGLEKAYQSSFCGVAHIPLDNILISPQMSLKINPFRVQFIKSSMKKRYNPAISVLVVCPVDDSKKVDVSTDKFYVVQKVKCLEAFKELDKTGDFVNLYGHHDRKVLSYILNNNKPEVMQYGNLSENLISGQFASRTVPQDILHHFHCLTMRDSSVKAIKVVERMSRLCCIRSEECTALERICKWSNNGFTAFMTVLEKYERYQTKDVKSTGLVQRIARGEKLNLSNVLLRLLGKCSEIYFLENYQKVLDMSISFRELAENHQEVLEVEKVLKVLSKIAKYVAVDTIQKLHPGKFEEETMKDYIGAVFDENIKNQKAVELENYYDFVISTPADEVFAKPVDFVVYEAVNDIFEDEEIMAMADMIIYNMDISNKDDINNICNSVLGGNKAFHAALLMFPCELDYFDVLSFLRSQQPITNMIKGFEIVPLLFNKGLKGGDTNKIGENIQYGLLFGKLTLLKSPLLVHYSDPAQIIKVVESICPPKQRVCFISGPGLAPIQIHNEDLEWKVKYFGTDYDLSKFKKKLSADKNPAKIDSHIQKEGLEQDNSDHENEDTASTSTTPAKSVHKKLKESPYITPDKSSPGNSSSTTPEMASPSEIDDSGFMESQQKLSSSVSKSLNFLSEMSRIESDV